MSKTTHPFVQMLVMLAIALGMLLFVSVVMLVMGMACPDIDLYSTNVLLLTQGITQVLTFIVPVLLMTLIYYKGCAREYYRLDFSGRKWLLGLAGVVVLLLIIPLNEFLTEWNDSWNLGVLGERLRALQGQTEGVVDQILKADTIGGLFANLVVVAFIPAVSEELFFRSGIQNLLQRWFRNPHAAIWVTAVVFSLGHGEIFSFMPRFVLGAMLGYLYVYSGSLLPNMLVHFVNNAIVVVLYWLVARGVLDIDPEAPIDFGLVQTFACTVAAVGVMWVTFFGKKLKNSSI